MKLEEEGLRRGEGSRPSDSVAGPEGLQFTRVFERFIDWATAPEESTRASAAAPICGGWKPLAYSSDRPGTSPGISSATAIAFAWHQEETARSCIFMVFTGLVSMMCGFESFALKLFRVRLLDLERSGKLELVEYRFRTSV